MKNNKLLIILCTILAILAIVIVGLLFSIKSKESFKKPDFDSNVTEIPSDLDYQKSVLNILDGYSIYISPNPKIVDDDCLKIDFLSVSTNNVYVKVRILDSENNIIGETGILKAGDYLEKVKLSKSVKVNDNITYKIMGYDQDNYTSAGSVSLNTRIGE